VTSLGYTFSVFGFPSSMLGTRRAGVEMHSLDLSQDPPFEHAGDARANTTWTDQW